MTLKLRVFLAVVPIFVDLKCLLQRSNAFFLLAHGLIKFVI